MQLTPEEELKMQAFVAQAFDFARYNDKESLEIMLNAGLNVNLANHKGDTLLMLAAYNNNLETAELLLKHGAEVDKKNDKQHTPLAGVCFKGHLQMAELLIKYGADPDYAYFPLQRHRVSVQRTSGPAESRCIHRRERPSWRPASSGRTRFRTWSCKGP